MENELIFSDGNTILEEANSRHQNVWPFALEAIGLAYLAFDRQRELTAPLVPGVPRLARARHDINDDSWRFFRSIAEPLIAEGHIREFATVDGGDVVIMPDGLHVRLKKGDAAGATSNYPTPKISKMQHAVTRYSLYSGATELDKYIMDGLGIDVVFVVGESMAEHKQVGLRFMNAKISPFLVIDPPTQQELQGISPAACDLVADAKTRLA